VTHFTDCSTNLSAQINQIKG